MPVCLQILLILPGIRCQRVLWPRSCWSRVVFLWTLILSTYWDKSPQQRESEIVRSLTPETEFSRPTATARRVWKMPLVPVSRPKMGCNKSWQRRKSESAAWLRGPPAVTSDDQPADGNDVRGIFVQANWRQLRGAGASLCFKEQTQCCVVSNLGTSRGELPSPVIARCALQAQGISLHVVRVGAGTECVHWNKWKQRYRKTLIAFSFPFTLLWVSVSFFLFPSSEGWTEAGAGKKENHFFQMPEFMLQLLETLTNYHLIGNTP